MDTYYRRCSSASYVGNVSVPLLCINALDDPLCTREAIPWDECRWIFLLKLMLLIPEQLFMYHGDLYLIYDH